MRYFTFPTKILAKLIVPLILLTSSNGFAKSCLETEAEIYNDIKYLGKIAASKQYDLFTICPMIDNILTKFKCTGLDDTLDKVQVELFSASIKLKCFRYRR